MKGSLVLEMPISSFRSTSATNQPLVYSLLQAIFCNTMQEGMSIHRRGVTEDLEALENTQSRALSDLQPSRGVPLSSFHTLTHYSFAHPPLTVSSTKAILRSFSSWVKVQLACAGLVVQQPQQPEHRRPWVVQKEYEFAVEVTAGPPTSVFCHTKVSAYSHVAA